MYIIRLLPYILYLGRDYGDENLSDLALMNEHGQNSPSYLSKR